MRTVLCAAFAYFAGVFLAGVALGSLRVLALEPAVGDPAATLIEAPLMLGISWAVCRAAIRRFAVGRGAAARLGMGLAAFAFLIGTETKKIGIFRLAARIVRIRPYSMNLPIGMFDAFLDDEGVRQKDLRVPQAPVGVGVGVGVTP